MAVALVGAGAGTSTASGATSWSITVASTTAGNTLVVAVAAFSPTSSVTSISAGGNAMTKVCRATGFAGGSFDAEFWKLESIPSGITSISATCGSGAWTAIAGEFSGLGASNINDVINDAGKNIASGSTWTTNNIATSAAAGVFGWAYDGGASGNNITATSPNVLVLKRNNASDGETLGFTYADRATSGTYNAAGGKTNNANQFGTYVMSLLAATGGGGGTVSHLLTTMGVGG